MSKAAEMVDDIEAAARRLMWAVARESHREVVDGMRQRQMVREQHETIARMHLESLLAKTQGEEKADG